MGNLEKGIVVVLVGLIALLIYACVSQSIYEKEHPCLRYGSRQNCYMTGYFLNTGKTLTYVPGYYYDCTPCLERK